ncbi:uncharacterized protein K460DRAFT_406676 [Cucurbitaria berberidis CBS 394.84]|uniref:HNH nuclease domain-containing protein n=1 Tax=Cucurbitaria berberidis CBS 394.84 TaxID=1168544 RepID=A0A9P4L9J0_9PLEO|nr:uncharacterized protein K460DRAFT_406676 [Cucurbitaria berberidis CBS 394.84]KAF1846473.1 hypothetical protein K460DRAFT_406676 [Cucurbitaria berberidis CBS 394.84]
MDRKTLLDRLTHKLQKRSSTSALRLFPKSKPSTRLEGRGVRPAIAFHHAGYNPKDLNDTVILRLRGCVRHKNGVKATTAIIALNIVTGNTFRSDSYLTSERRGQRIHLRPDDILELPEYWFHVHDPECPFIEYDNAYICPSFAMWKFPHKNLPPSWDVDRRKGYTAGRNISEWQGRTTDSRVNASIAVRMRDGSCVLSGVSNLECYCAYIIQSPQSSWYHEELLSQYVSQENPNAKRAIYCPQNGITLRRDLYRAFGDGEFAIVPKGKHWVAHFFDATTRLGEEFDQKRVRLSSDIPKELLFAKFAACVFPLVRGFVQQGEQLEAGNPF